MNEGRKEDEMKEERKEGIKEGMKERREGGITGPGSTARCVQVQLPRGGIISVRNNQLK